MIKIKPCGPTAKSTIYEKRHRTLGWARAIGELIDNSVGNGAGKVRVLFQPHFVLCIDDGVGCTEEKFAALVSLGMHVEDEKVKNSVSLFGVGAKDAFIWAGGPTTVYSSRGTLHQYIEVDWDAFGAEWDYEEIATGNWAKRECERVGLLHDGVAIVIPHHTRQMNEKVFNDLRKQLSSLFWAAVETGVEITVEYQANPKRGKIIGGPLLGKSMPDLIAEHSIDDTIELSDGRSVRICGGVLSPNVRISSPGFEYLYGHRVVVTAGGLGAGGMDFERCYFRVFLLGEKESWRVTTNKDRLHDADEAILGQAVYDHCKSVLQHSQSEAVAALVDQDLLDEVSDMLTSGHRRRGARRPNSNPTGTVEPTGTGRKHSRRENVHDEPGPYRTKGSRGKIQLKRASFPEEEEHLVGKAVIPDRIVRINTSHEFVKRCLDSRDRIGLFVMAMALWSDAWTRIDASGQGRLIARGEFVDKISAMLKTDDLQLHKEDAA